MGGALIIFGMKAPREVAIEAVKQLPASALWSDVLKCLSDAKTKSEQPKEMQHSEETGQ
jgi:hypothetical protein